MRDARSLAISIGVSALKRKSEQQTIGHCPLRQVMGDTCLAGGPKHSKSLTAFPSFKSDQKVTKFFRTTQIWEICPGSEMNSALIFMNTKAGRNGPQNGPRIATVPLVSSE